MMLNHFHWLNNIVLIQNRREPERFPCWLSMNNYRPIGGNRTMGSIFHVGVDMATVTMVWIPLPRFLLKF